MWIFWSSKHVLFYFIIFMVLVCNTYTTIVHSFYLHLVSHYQYFVHFRPRAFLRKRDHMIYNDTPGNLVLYTDA